MPPSDPLRQGTRLEHPTVIDGKGGKDDVLDLCKKIIKNKDKQTNKILKVNLELPCRQNGGDTGREVLTHLPSNNPP